MGSSVSTGSFASSTLCVTPRGGDVNTRGTQEDKNTRAVVVIMAGTEVED